MSAFSDMKQIQELAEELTDGHAENALKLLSLALADYLVNMGETGVEMSLGGYVVEHQIRFDSE